jgi:signal transduction histidine kinase
MLCVVTEETERIIGERRMLLLRELGADLAATKTQEEVLAAVERRLGAHTRDLPFSLTYLFESEGVCALLACNTGIDAGHAAAPMLVETGSRDALWPVDEVLSKATTILVHDLAERLQEVRLPAGAWDRPPNQAVVVPIKQQAQDRPAGFLVAGINPYRRFDRAYVGFIDLLAGQIAAGLANARAYEEERKRAESLAELDRAKTAFFSNVSHEFRTPLTLMLGPIEDMISKAETRGSPEDHELLSVVHRNGLRLQKLVNTLLDFARIEAGRAHASYEPTDLAAFTTELASNFRSAMERAGLEFRVDCRPLPRPVYVDREMWEKVVLNLLSNAFKYTLAGSVTVRLTDAGNHAELCISDTGLGIPEDEAPHVFERFHRVEGSGGRTHEGTGIGLALVQELVRLHGGKAGVTSTLGQGSTFRVTIPFGTAHLPPDRLQATRTISLTSVHAEAYVEEALRWLPGEVTDTDSFPETASGFSNPVTARERILLADDNADMRDYVSRLLAAHYEVEAVANGEAALSAALRTVPDLVLTDVMMPVLDGFGLLRRLRAHTTTQTLPVIFLSARAGEESRVEGLDAGADDYLVKPFTARELLARVDAHFSLARMRRQADQARRMSEARLGLALEATRMVAWEWNPETDEISNTGDLRGIFGISPRTSAEGFRLVHPEDFDKHRAVWQRVSREGGSYISEFRIYREDTGALAWLEDRATGIMDETGRVIRVVGVLADITDRKSAEDEIRRRNEELLRANKELEEFAYVSSHDLQEPLRMVNVYTQLLLKRHVPLDNREAQEYAEFVRSGVKRMEALIRDLLSYSRVIRPQGDELKERADLNASLLQALSLMKTRVEESGARLTYETLPVVIGDESQLAHVFLNLISNSLKYCLAGSTPEIHIRAERMKDEWIISARDNGIGFAPQYAERIFGLFKRLHRDAYPGTGLGLAICRRIVERYRGRMWAESGGEGTGATFYFALMSAED